MEDEDEAPRGDTDTTARFRARMGKFIDAGISVTRGLPYVQRKAIIQGILEEGLEKAVADAREDAAELSDAEIQELTRRIQRIADAYLKERMREIQH